MLDAYLEAGEADLVHDHSGLVGPALGALASPVPVVHTLHGAWTDANRRVYHRLADRVHLVAISHDQARRRPTGLPLAGVVPNATSRSWPVVASDRSAQPLDENANAAGVLVVDISDPTAPEVVNEIGPPHQGLEGQTSRELRVGPQQELLIVQNLGSNCSYLIHASRRGA